MKSVNLVAAIAYHGNYLPGDFIGVDKGVSYLLENDIDILAAIGDFDSLSSSNYQALIDLNTNIIKLPMHKDETDLEFALKYVKQQGYDIINIYGALGQRIDHSMVNYNLLKKHRSITLYDDYSKIYILEKGTHFIEKSIYKYYSFFAIEECRITLSNFVYPLSNYLLKLDDTLCISNELLDEAKVIVDKDIIVVASL